MHLIFGIEIDTFIVNRPDLRLTAAAIAISMSQGSRRPVCTCVCACSVLKEKGKRDAGTVEVIERELSQSRYSMDLTITILKVFGFLVSLCWK